jgi:multicomponent Na+:H+ antiporter subunit C
VTWAVALTLGVVLAAGTWLALSRDILRCVIGLSVVGSGINLLVFAAGRLTSAVPPIVPNGALRLADSANPLPQALVLTAIVIGFALLCLSLALAARLIETAGTSDATRLAAAEPPPGVGGKPDIEDET